jgi:hypothetical protein
VNRSTSTIKSFGRFGGLHGSQSTLFFGLISFFAPLFVATQKFGFKPGSFSTPLFFYGDEFFGAAWIKSLIDSFGLRNETFGYPTGQDFNYAFVSQDNLPHIFAAIIGAFKSDPYFGLNVYMLLTFGLVGVLFFTAAKMLSASNWVAAALAIGVSLLPQHFSSSTQAITVISYYAIPILIAKATLELKNRNLEVKEKISSKSRILWASFFIVSGMLYSYYSIGTIVIFGTTAIIVSLIDGNLKPIKSLAPIVLGTAVGFVLVAIPSLIYVGKTTGGVNYYQDRSWQAAYVNSGSLIQSIAPSYGTTTYKFLEFLHSNWIATFDQLRTQINSYGIFQEGWAATIPLGLILLYFTVLSFIGSYSRRKQLDVGLKKSQEQIYLLGCIGLVSLLWMWAGGLGTIFAMFFSETLRGYSRFSVYAVSSLALGAAIGITKLLKTSFRDYKILKSLCTFTLILFVGDGLTIATYSQPVSIQSNVREIQNVVSKIPNDCKVLQFPVIHFPYESPGWPGYALMAPGLVTDREDIKWSSGLVGGSPAWAFMMKYREFQNQPSLKLVDLAKEDGFCGILIDKNVWETFYNFMPSPTYSRVPGANLEDFLNQVEPYSEYKTTLTTYYFHLLK